MDRANKSEETEAGIDRLQKFGIYLALDALSNGDMLRHEQILKLPYKEIMLALWVSKEQSEYGERLRRVLDKRSRNRGK